MFDESDDKVDTLHGEYAKASPSWQRCRDVHAGSDKVKAAGTLYLPSLEWRHNRQQQYAAYLQRALFYNATARTVSGLLGAVFRKDLNVLAPDSVAPALADVTLTSMPLAAFAMEACQEQLLVGRFGMLLDMQSGESVEARPYWVPYFAEQIVNWRVTVQNGDAMVSLVVLKEGVTTADTKNRFATKTAHQYRVLELIEGVYTSTVWRRPEDPKTSNAAHYVPDEPVVPMRRGAPLAFIPFVFLGPSSLSPAIERPPLLDLVDVNLSHYRSSADLEHGRHWTAVPTPWVSGFKGAGPIEVGASTAILLEDPAAKAGMLEFTGQGLKALETALEQKERLMAILGARLLEGAPSTQETAEAVKLRHTGDAATLKVIALTLGRALTQMLQWHVWWTGLDPRADEVSVTPNVDFFGLHLSADEVRALLEALQANKISYDTFYDRLQRGEWVRPAVPVEQEREDIRKDGGAAA